MDVFELDRSGLFADLSDEERSALGQVMRVEQYPVGKVLAEEGEPSSKFFVILDGHVTVHRQGRHLADLGPGDIFGEMGVLSLEARNATVIATTPVQVAAAMGWDLRTAIEGMPKLRERLEASAAARQSSD
ncbi:MAG TPA: cyclic nucleotide-binding domain-containing protein [Acidimicrobiia bacterium]|nr:cyclic nucleotide-binding domain-containing protein [Acidimicrobiia bacterium]